MIGEILKNIFKRTGSIEVQPDLQADFKYALEVHLPIKEFHYPQQVLATQQSLQNNNYNNYFENLFPFSFHSM